MSYLPLAFHYEGMYKIKAGKGYDNKGHPRGPIGGKCSECDGDIISIKMNTSARGFETTSEKVCNKCGLIVPGAFQTLESKPEYKSKYYATHEAWIEDQCMDKVDDDIAWDTEQYAHATGQRLNTYDDVPYAMPTKDGGRMFLDNKAIYFNSGYGIGKKEAQTLAYALKLNNWKSEFWNRGTDERMQHKLREQYNYVDVCKSLIGLTNGQVAHVKYILKEYGVKYFHRQLAYEDIISHICLVVISYSMKPQRFSVLVREYKRYNSYNRVLYQRIKDMLV